VSFERLRDPEAIAFWPHGIGRDGARTPMPWRRAAPMAGFTEAADAWLPLDPRHVALAVDVQEAEPDSMLAFARATIALRRACPALREGEFETLAAPEPLLAFERRAPGQTLLCLFNLGAEPVEFAGAEGSVRLAVGAASATGGRATLGGQAGLVLER
jgi:alpha-glucosidase